MGKRASEIGRYFTPYSYALYLWTFLLTVFLAQRALVGRLAYDPLLVAPAVWLILAALFLLVCGLRVPLLDALSGMGYNEKFCLFLVCVMAFATPYLVSRLNGNTPRLVHSLLGLQLPLILMLVDERGFRRVLGVDLLILIACCLENAEQPLDSALYAAAALYPFTLCFVLDYFCFRGERAETFERPAARVATRRLLRAHWLAFKYYAAAAAIALALFWLRPVYPESIEAGKWRLPHWSEALGSRPGATLSSAEIESIIYHSGALILLVLGVLALLHYLRKRLLGGGAEERPSVKPGLARMLEIIEHPGRALRRRTGGDPREMILQTYYWFCDRAGARGAPRPPDLTPREYADSLAARFPGSKEAVGEITSVFERAKYGFNPPLLEEAKAYQQLARQFFRGRR